MSLCPGTCGFAQVMGKKGVASAEADKHLGDDQVVNGSESLGLKVHGSC